MIQRAWRFLLFQKNSALARWYQARTADHRAATRKTMIVALARKLLVALALCHHRRDTGGRRLTSSGLKGSCVRQVQQIGHGDGGWFNQVNSDIALFDRLDHPFVPTCRLAERRAQRQSRMPPRRRRHRRSRRAASLTERARC